MSRLSAFLHPATDGIEKDVCVSDRFKDEKGNTVPVKIRALTQEESEKMRRASTHRAVKNGQPVDEFDPDEYNHRLLLKAVIDPDLSSEEACKACGVLDPLMVPGKLFLAGEYTKLMTEINRISGFGTVEDEAKN